MSKHTPGPWVMEAGEPEVSEGWKISAPNSPHPLGSQYTREDNVVGACCSAGVYREEDARLITAAPDMHGALREADMALGMAWSLLGDQQLVDKLSKEDINEVRMTLQAAQDRAQIAVKKASGQ